MGAPRPEARVSDRTAAGHGRPITIAHRFGNTLARLRAAEDAGADVVELDVWRDRGRLEVRHARTLGPLPLLWERAHLMRRPAQPLLLADVIAAARPTTGFMVDLKGSDPELPHEVAHALAGHCEGRIVMVSARFWPLLLSLRDHPEITLFHSIGTERNLVDVAPLLSERENDAVSIHYRLLSDDRVRELREHVRIIATWPINNDDQLARTRAWGVDAIISDNLDLLARVARERDNNGRP
jgi:glycerophosphoryl diester phosphodiesterase